MMTLFIYVGCKIDSEEPTPNATTTTSDEQLLNAAQQVQKGAIIWEFSAPSNDWIETNQNSNCLLYTSLIAIKYNIALAVQMVDLLFTQMQTLHNATNSKL